VGSDPSSNASTGGGPVSGDGSETGSGLSYTVMGPLTFGPGKCLPEPIEADANCQVLTTRSGADCGCSEPGLVPSKSGVTEAMRKQLELVGYCGNPGQAPCADYCSCEVSRAIGKSLIECQTLPGASAESSGWCYVAAEAGEPQADLVADCPKVQRQKLRFVGSPSLLSGMPSFLACLDGGEPVPHGELGEVCFDEQYDSARYSVREVNIIDRSSLCSSGICVVNHFQGLVSCPYGQAAGAADCLRPGSNEAISGAIPPQLVERQAAVASICSCQCDGPGPGPYCTCPESMQCEHLIDDLGLGSSNLAGSYCIPKGSAYTASDPQTPCVQSNCGVEHPY
jgi:hypothetical protein